VEGGVGSDRQQTGPPPPGAGGGAGDGRAAPEPRNRRRGAVFRGGGGGIAAESPVSLLQSRRGRRGRASWLSFGELLLWQFAPKMTDKETQTRDWNERFWALMQRPSDIGFTFRQLTTALAQSWGLPNLVVMLIKGTDTPRANIARLAADAARLITLDPEVPGLLDLLREVAKVVPGSLAELAAPLPLPDDIRAALLTAIEAAPPAE